VRLINLIGGAENRRTTGHPRRFVVFPAADADIVVS
jgi:hypothetical protein